MRILIFSLLLITFTNSPATAETLKFLSIDYCPFTCNTETENGKEGFMVDVLKTIFKKKGITIDIVQVPYEKAIKFINSDEFDGMVIAGKSASPQLIYPKASIGPNYVTFLVRKDDHWKYSGVESLKNRKIAIIEGFDYGSKEVNDYLYSGAKNVEIMSSDGNATKRNLLKLINKRVDVYIEGSVTLNYSMYKLHFADQLKEAGALGFIFYNYTAFSEHKKKSHHYATLYDQGVQELIESGELVKIYNKYGLDNLLEK